MSNLVILQGTIECWDPRSHSRVGELSLAVTGIQFSDRCVYVHDIVSCIYITIMYYVN